MIEGIILAGIAFWLLRDPRPQGDAIPPPYDADWDLSGGWDHYVWESIASGEGRDDQPTHVWAFGSLHGRLGQPDAEGNPTGDTRHYEYQYVLGNPDHSRFVRASAWVPGTIYISKKASGSDKNQDNVFIYTRQGAIDKLEELSETPDPSPTDPQPHDPNEGDDSGSSEPDYTGGGVPTFGGSRAPSTGSGQFQNTGATDLGVNMFGN